MELAKLKTILQESNFRQKEIQTYQTRFKAPAIDDQANDIT